MATLSHDSQGLFEFLGEFDNFRGDFGRLLRDRVDHFLSQFRFEADQLNGRHHEGQLIVDFMAHVREFLIQLFDLFRVQCHLRFRHTAVKNDFRGPDNQVRSVVARGCPKAGLGP